MGFRINTNIAALNAHTNAVRNNKSLDSSLSRLSSGLRINKAADDASGMAIADSLRSQANSLGQAISNANDGISLVQTADGAMDEQLKILDTIKTKAIQAASDGQTSSSREAIQKDVNRLLEQLDNIAKTTSFNGQKLLSGQFANKEFQVGAYSNETIKVSISNTQSQAIGNVTTQDNIIELGNTVAATVANSKGTTEIAITATDLDGMAIGDKISIEGQSGTFTIADFTDGAGAGDSASTALGVLLDRALDANMAVGDKISVVEHAGIPAGSALNADIASGVAAFTLASGDLSAGFAVGDTIRLTDSSTGNSEAMTIGDIDESGVVALTGLTALAYTAANTTISFDSRADIGSAMTVQSDFVQYTVEGETLTAVQLTDTNGNGAANTGLGKVADMVNSTTDKTGVKAVATVVMDSAIGVQGGTINSDMTINGTTILTSGTSLLAGDTDSTLVNSINQQTQVTGVTAGMGPDGSLTLSSDGRAINLSGFSGSTGLADGLFAGTIEFSKQGLDPVTLSSAHYTEAGLGTVNTGATSQDKIAEFSKLSDLKYGTNGSDNVVGLLMTKEGAMQAMDIVESAISGLDSIRADLGSTQNQLSVTVNNISVTQVNVRSAESSIRDVDFAQESANFSKFNILAQSGSYAMSQANAVQQNVLRLLQ